MSVLEKLISKFLCCFSRTYQALKIEIISSLWCNHFKRVFDFFSEEVRYNRAMLMEIREHIQLSTRKDTKELVPLPYFNSIMEVKDFSPTAEEYTKQVCLSS